ncbi:MAG: 3-deoxy-manno-octulosonate cytidylyltransferase [Candidatus Kapaibacteriales bacterium]
MDIKNSIGIIPARIGSTRLPRKLLSDLNGKPVLKWVIDGVTSSMYLRRLVVATDSEEISNLCRKNSIEYVMTPSELPSGSDRVFYAYNLLNEKAEFIVNIQGDEPFITGELVDLLLENLAYSDADVSTLVTKISNKEEIFDPSVVKVVMNKWNLALYFSRNPIPFVRNVSKEEWGSYNSFYKHIGIYAFRAPILKIFTILEESQLEKAEKLEQLRLLENAYKILCVRTDKFLIGIDTEEDLIKAKNYLARFPSF